MISNLKSWLQGTHLGMSGEHLQVNLDEYAFRFNRRRTPMAAFQTLLGLGGAPAPSGRWLPPRNAGSDTPDRRGRPVGVGLAAGRSCILRFSQ